MTLGNDKITRKLPRSSTPVIALLTLLLATSGMVVKGRSQPINNVDALQIRMEELMVAGRYPEALRVAKRLLHLAKRQYASTRVSAARAGFDVPMEALRTVLGSLAQLNEFLGHFADAERVARRRFDLEEEIFGPGARLTPEQIRRGWDLGYVTGQMTNALQYLGGFYRRQGRYDDAGPLFARAAAIEAAVSGPKSYGVAANTAILADLAWRRGRLKEADELFQRALSIKSGAAESYYVRYLLDQRRFTEAEPILQRFLSGAERDLRELPSGHNRVEAGTAVANTLDDLAGIRLKQGHIPEATRLLRRALAAHEEVSGPSHAALVYALDRLALALQMQGLYADAVPLLDRALRIDRQWGGEQSHHVALRHAAIGRNRFGLKRAGEALDSFRRGIRVFEANAYRPTGTHDDHEERARGDEFDFASAVEAAWMSMNAQDRPDMGIAKEAFRWCNNSPLCGSVTHA